MRRFGYILLASIALMMGASSCSLLYNTPGYDEVVAYGTPYTYGGQTYYYYNNYYYMPYYEGDRYYVRRARNFPGDRYGYGYNDGYYGDQYYNDSYYSNRRDNRAVNRGPVQGRRPNGNDNNGYGNRGGNGRRPGNAVANSGGQPNYHSGDYERSGGPARRPGNSGGVNARYNGSVNVGKATTPNVEYRSAERGHSNSNVNSTPPRRATTSQGSSTNYSAPQPQPSRSVQSSQQSSSRNSNSSSGSTTVTGHRR